MKPKEIITYELKMKISIFVFDVVKLLELFLDIRDGNGEGRGGDQFSRIHS